MNEGVMLQADSRYAVFSEVRGRYEEFGGVVYRRNTDSLFFLHSRLAMDLIFLAGTGTVDEIAERVRGGHAKRPVLAQVLKILQQLKELGVIYELEH